ncbi:hypothetical protein PY254_16335 [Rhodanobacter sp. AS-Z3]|uniref:hypothetical protein n=1 Tax=Rhodanobacter sp. AS-Z3 TaxID=3031330 RepID=UPI00247A1FD5|nr:hypothetical protein [Rhodanobacter sp. AS-Z3]WEN14781.1 hypothetical protein PY254_16335 [Rhodanobacter sp. AS-Z3]
MDTATIGLFVGATPGVVIILRNMWYQQTLQKQIQAVAWEEQNWNATQLGFRQQFNLLFHPEKYVSPSDGPAMVKAKQALLSAWPQIRRRHWIGGGVLVLGAILGVVVGVALA